MRIKYMILMVLTSAIYATQSAQAQAAYGFRIGANVGTFSGEFNADPESSVGFVAGSFIRYSLQNDLGAQVEILYSQKGARFGAVTLEGEPFERTLQVTYLEIPVLLTYSPYLNTSLQPLVYAGGALGFEIGEQIRERLGDFEQTQETDDLASPDLGVVLGADVQIPISIIDALLGIRYTHGLRNLANPGVVDGAEALTRTFAVTIGFLL